MVRSPILSFIGSSAFWLGEQLLYSCATVQYLFAEINTVTNQFVLRLALGRFNAIIPTHLMLGITILLLACLFY